MEERLFMMKKTLQSLLALALILALCACGSPAASPVADSTPAPSPVLDNTPVPSPVPDNTPNQQPTPDVTPGATPVPQDYSPTTGRAGYSAYNPVAVMIEESSAARPQVNLSQADVVYELKVEGGFTRMMAIFNDNLPEKVGYVRSMRIYFARLATEWDPVLVHYGGPSGDSSINIYQYIKNKTWRAWVDGMQYDGTSYVWRDTSRKAPSNALANIKLAAAKATSSPKWVHAYSFTDTPYSGPTAHTVSFNMDMKKYQYRYDAATNSYKRFLDGKAFMDGATGTQLSPANVIIQYTKHTLVGNAANHKLIDVIGQGKCQVFSGGVAIQGTWKKGSEQEQTRFYDANGQEIKLQRGSTFIHFVDLNANVSWS
nr:DUF3048 domain-containing protein [bacterium]